jgi:hypothetical protein
MQILTSAADINAEFLRLIEECASCQIAVAWASTGFDAFVGETTAARRNEENWHD